MKRECGCKIAQHEHGTRTMYVVDKCRCDDCREASRRVEWERRRAILYGRYETGRVPAEPVREHIHFLMNNGVSYKQLAKVSGLSTSTVSAIIYGRHERGHAPYRRVSARTAAAILAVRPIMDNMADGALLDPAGTMRRLQALVRIGWSQSKLCERLGVLPSNGTALFAGRGYVTVKRAKAVRALYEELWDQPRRPNEWRERIATNRSINRATALGWLPPMAWDDDTIDDPATEPMSHDVSAFVHAEERFADIQFLIETGCGLDEIVRRSGYNSLQALERACYRYGNGDLVARVKNTRFMERVA